MLVLTVCIADPWEGHPDPFNEYSGDASPVFLSAIFLVFPG